MDLAWSEVPWQIIIAILFAVFALKLLDMTNKATEKRDQQWQTYFENLENKRRETIQDNHAQWREFLREERQANHMAIARIAEEVKRNTEAIVANTTTLIAHDTRAADAIGDVRRIRERLAQARVGDVEDSPLPGGRKA